MSLDFPWVWAKEKGPEGATSSPLSHTGRAVTALFKVGSFYSREELSHCLYTLCVHPTGVFENRKGNFVRHLNLLFRELLSYIPGPFFIGWLSFINW